MRPAKSALKITSKYTRDFDHSQLVGHIMFTEEQQIEVYSRIPLHLQQFFKEEHAYNEKHLPHRFSHFVDYNFDGDARKLVVDEKTFSFSKFFLKDLLGSSKPEAYFFKIFLTISAYWVILKTKRAWWNYQGKNSQTVAAGEIADPSFNAAAESELILFENSQLIAELKNETVIWDPDPSDSLTNETIASQFDTFSHCVNNKGLTA